MSPVPSVRSFVASEWRAYRDVRLRALADSPDAFGSTYESEKADLDADWAARLARGTASESELPLLAEMGRTPAGLAWVIVNDTDASIANLYQMWVAPEFRGRGLGRMLLDAAIDWARSRKLRALVLGVTRGNSPATRLYANAGFKPFGSPAPLRPGSALLLQTMRLDL